MGLMRLILPLVWITLLCSNQVTSDIKTASFINYADNVVRSQEAEAGLVVKGSNRRLLPFMDCEGLCKQRCSLHSRPKVCTRACGTCCVRCKCVPPGTSGNRELCGKCYTDMTTHGNRTKCP